MDNKKNSTRGISNRGKEIVLYGTLLVVGLFFLFYGLILAKSFLAPLAISLVLAFVMFPLSARLERWGFKRIWATIVSSLTLFIITIGFVTILFFQIKDFTEDWEAIQTHFNELLEGLEVYLVENTLLTEDAASNIVGVAGSKKKDKDNDKKQSENDNENSGIGMSEDDDEDNSDKSHDNIENGSKEGYDNEEQESTLSDAELADITEDTQEQVMFVMAGVVAFVTDFLVVFVYVFMFIQFRQMFKKFILRLFPPDQREKVNKIVVQSAGVSRQYLLGRLFLMAILAVMYYVGLLISGVENALLLALISAAFSIIPVVGNFLGYSLSVAVSMVTSGGIGAVIGISVTYLVAQIVDTYILQPIVLGERVGVHPFFIIFSVILGYEVWGIIGMVLSIPVFGVITIILRNVDFTMALGYLLSNKEPEELKMERNTKYL